jgi:phage baseplate assembly protein gpV
LISTLQEIIRDELRTVRLAELGVVEATFPHSDSGDMDNYGCDVRLQGSDLLLKKVPVSTGHIGTAAIPNVGDLVLVVYENGDIHQPIIIGRLYNDTERPPANRNDEVIFRLPLQESDDQTVMAAVRNIQGREIKIEMPSKITIQIVDDTVTLTAGQMEVVLDQPGSAGGVASIQAGRSKITIKQDGDLAIEAAGNISLKTSTGDITLEGMNVKIKGSVDASMEAGVQANLKGSVAATVEGGASTTVKGAIVQVNGTAMFSPA